MKKTPPASSDRVRTWDSPEYIAFCATQAKRVNIRYADEQDWHEAVFTHTWRRNDPEIQRGPIMSASSGPKDYLKNDIISLVADPAVDAVSMFVLRSVIFLVLRKGGRLEDVTGRQVQLYWEKATNERTTG